VPAPATKIEAFKPVEGSVLTVGFNDIASGIHNVSLDARQLTSSDGGSVKGMRVEVMESEYRKEVVFIDADELPELIKAIDHLLAINSNPTSFKDFEVHYKTRGSLELGAFSGTSGRIQYSIAAGRLTKATTFTDVKGLASLQEGFVKAKEKLDSVSK
jgi:hypothetical protein